MCKKEIVAWAAQAGKQARHTGRQAAQEFTHRPAELLLKGDGFGAGATWQEPILVGKVPCRQEFTLPTKTQTEESSVFKAPLS